MEADWRRGLRTGLKLSLMVFLVNHGLSIIYVEVVLKWYAGYDDIPDVDSTQVLIWMFTDMVTTIIACVFIGIVFAVLYSILPFQSSPPKGVILYVSLWSLYTILFTIRAEYMFGSLPFMRGWLLVGLLMAFLYGYLLGVLWDGDRPSEDD